MHYDGDSMGFFKKSQGPGRGPGEIQTVNVIDFDPLLVEITPELPSGENDLEYDPAFIELEKNIQGLPKLKSAGKSFRKPKNPTGLRFKPPRANY